MIDQLRISDCACLPAGREWGMDNPNFIWSIDFSPHHLITPSPHLLSQKGHL